MVGVTENSWVIDFLDSAVACEAWDRHGGVGGATASVRATMKAYGHVLDTLLLPHILGAPMASVRTTVKQEPPEDVVRSFIEVMVPTFASVYPNF